MSVGEAQRPTLDQVRALGEDRPGSARALDFPTANLAANREGKGKQRQQVLFVHADHPAGLTDDEVANILEIASTSAGKRRLELVRLGVIAPTLLRRPTRFGSPAIVWAITQQGVQAARMARA